MHFVYNFKFTELFIIDKLAPETRSLDRSSMIVGFARNLNQV